MRFNEGSCSTVRQIGNEWQRTTLSRASSRLNLTLTPWDVGRLKFSPLKTDFGKILHLTAAGKMEIDISKTFMRRSQDNGKFLNSEDFLSYFRLLTEFLPSVSLFNSCMFQFHILPHSRGDKERSRWAQVTHSRLCPVERIRCNSRNEWHELRIIKQRQRFFIRFLALNFTTEKNFSSFISLLRSEEK